MARGVKADIRNVAMAISLSAAVLMLVGKLTASYVTGSAAIFSDAAESVVHILATGIAGFSLWFSHKPACSRHPYGHGKAAYFSAGFEGALIVSVAVFIVYSSVLALIRGPELQELGVGIVITGGLGLLNLGLGLFLIAVGKRKNALILVANGKHVLTDMWTSLGVVVGIGVVWVTGLQWLDPVIAIVVALNILWSAESLIKRSLQGLLDEADSGQTRLLVECLDGQVSGGVIKGYHQLRHRQSNDVVYVEVHMLLPGGLTVNEAHGRVTQAETAVRESFPAFEVFVTSHVEPVKHVMAHPAGHPEQPDPYRPEADIVATQPGESDT